jgi:hypothetical protein
MATQLHAGTRIYRPARLAAGKNLQVVLETPGMKDFGDDTTMLRAVPHPAYLPDWLAVPWETDGGRVCVCDEPIPDDWTYFEVFSRTSTLWRWHPWPATWRNSKKGTWKPLEGLEVGEVAASFS